MISSLKEGYQAYKLGRMKGLERGLYVCLTLATCKYKGSRQCYNDFATFATRNDK